MRPLIFYYVNRNYIAKLFLLLVLLAFYSCATQTQITFINPQGKNAVTETENPVKELVSKFDYKFFQHSASKIEIPAGIRSKIHPDDILLLGPFENIDDSIHSFQSILKYSLINKLINSRLRVVERDKMPLYRMYCEHNKEFNSGPPLDSVRYIFKNMPLVAPTKLLMYQVLDAGMKKFEFKPDVITRVGYFYVNFRLIDARTSEILGNEISEVFYEDQIQKSVNDQIETFAFNDVQYPLPLLNKLSSERSVTTSIQEQFANTSKVSIYVMLGSQPSRLVIVNDKTKSEVHEYYFPKGAANGKITEYVWEPKNILPGKYVLTITDLINRQVVLSQKEIVID